MIQGYRGSSAFFLHVRGSRDGDVVGLIGYFAKLD